MLRAPKNPWHHPAVLNSVKEGMEKSAFVFYCQLVGLGTAPHPAQVLIQGAAPHWPEKAQNHFPWGNPQTLHSQGAHSCHQSKKRHLRETKRWARNCEKRKGTQSLDASSESVQMFRTDSGLGSAASLHSHRKWINQLQHSNNSSSLLPELLSQLSRFRVPFASPAWLSPSLSSRLVPDSIPVSPCLLLGVSSLYPSPDLSSSPSLPHCCAQSSRHPSLTQNMKHKLELCGGLFVLAVTVVLLINASW